MSSVGEPNDFDLEAAEYVLGTLDRDERLAFQQRLRREGDAKRAVSAWELRFAGLDGFVAPVAPPPAVWERIERSLNAQGEPPRTFDVVDGGGLLADRTPIIARSRSRWRAAALTLGAVAAALAVFIATDRMSRLGAPEPAGGSYIAAVNRGGDKPALLVRVDLKTRQIFVMPVAAEAPSGRSLELWYIGDGKSPQAMGLVEKTATTLSIPDGAQAAGATFAVSVEPPGGSPTGGPTGPVVYSGQLIKE